MSHACTEHTCLASARPGYQQCIPCRGNDRSGLMLIRYLLARLPHGRAGHEGEELVGTLLLVERHLRGTRVREELAASKDGQ